MPSLPASDKANPHNGMKKTLLIFLTLATLNTARADYWTYLYLYYNGFQMFDVGKGMQQQSANMMLGTMMLPTGQGILNTEMDKLTVNQKELDNLAEVFDNIGIKAKSDGMGGTVVALDEAIQLGDVTDKTLENALKQAQALGLDPTQLQTMGAAAKATARAQAFDVTLRQYEQLGGRPMSLNERSALNAQIQSLADEQLNEQILLKVATEFAEASKNEQKLEAEQIGRRVVQGAALNGENINPQGDEYSSFAPAKKLELSPDLYKYQALGGIRKLMQVTDPVTGQPLQQVDPVTGQPVDVFTGEKQFVGDAPPNPENMAPGLSRAGEMALDNDGIPWFNKSMDGTYQSGTSMTINGRPVDGSQVPFIVANKDDRAGGVRVGDWAQVTNNSTGKTIWAIVADAGPDQARVEGSPALWDGLGVSHGLNSISGTATVTFYKKR